MGGNALTETFTRRYEKNEYFNIVDEVIAELHWEFEIERISDIPAYREKDSFGDLDILYSMPNNVQLTVDDIQELFSPNQIVKNSEVISFDYKEFQIDLIFIEKDRYKYALNYYSWNDTGNLIGKLAHQLGLKHGHKGLVLPLRDGSNKFFDVVLTLDHDKTLELLGLDVEKFNSGFSNLEDIFNFIVASPLYNPENYKLENLNSIAKIRDRKRDTYNKFLTFGEKYGTVPYVRTDKTVHLQSIFEFFPEAYPNYKTAIEKLAMQQLCKTKFNGEIVKKLTGFVGRELGEFMKLLRNDWYFRAENIVYLSDEQIHTRVLYLSKL